jgi:SSS family solute:Na+ symporter
MGYEKLADPLALGIFLLTLSLPILIGFLTLRRTRSQSDFLLGGRAMDKVVVALSAVSSGRSSWLVLGVSGMAWMMGTGAVWAVVGYILAELFQFIYIGRPLRRESEQFGSLTLLDWFETRFGDRRQVIRITGAVIIIVFMTAYVAAQFNAGAKALSIALDIHLLSALAIAGVLVLAYMVMGGYIAVAYNDVVRAVIMIVGLVVFPVVGLVKAGGVGVLLATLNRLNPAFIDPVSIGMGALIGFLGIGLGSPGQPHIVVRYMSVNDPDRLRAAAVIGTFWNVVLGWGAVFIGLLGRALVPLESGLPNADPEMIFLVLASDYFGPVLYGLMVGGIFAAILSTVDSQLLVVSSTFVRDLWEEVLHRDEEPEEALKLRLNRLVVVAAGLAALVVAYVAQDLVFWLVLFAWGGLGAAFGPAIIMTLYHQGTRRAGIVAGMVTGAVVTVLWRQFLKGPTGIYELVASFPAAVLAILVGSWWSRRRAGTG